MNAVKRQQFRWAKGSIQCAIKQGLDIAVKRKIQVDTKIQAFIQLTRHIVFPLILLQFLTLPILLASEVNLYIISYLPAVTLATYIVMGPFAYALIIQKMYGESWRSKLIQLPYFIMYNAGLSVNNTVAVFDAIFGKKNEFLRTPKYGILKNSDKWADKAYNLPFTKTTLLEMFFGIYGIFGVFIAIYSNNPTFVPIILIPTAGFLYIALMSISHSRFKTNKSKLNVPITREQRMANLTYKIESQKIQAALNQKGDSVKTSGGIKENIEKRLADIENESNFAQVKETMSECLKNTKTNAQTLEKISASLNNTSDTGKIESKLDSNAKMLEDVRKLLQSHTQEQDGMGKNIETEISEKISTISREVAGLREQIRGVSETQKTDELTEYVGSMVSKTEVLMGIPAELLELQSRLNAIEVKISEKGSNEKQPSVTLLEYQVKIRMISESKYGDADDLQYMASQTSEILKIVGKDKGANVSKWGVSRILECADRWELRFSDALSMMKDTLSADVLKEAIRIKQVKDVYGVRAVEDTKSLLNIT